MRWRRINGFDLCDRWGRASLRWAATATVAAMERPVSGKWFDELTEGLVIHHVIRRTITEADNVGFTTMTMNPARMRKHRDNNDDDDDDPAIPIPGPPIKNSSSGRSTPNDTSASPPPSA